MLLVRPARGFYASHSSAAKQTRPAIEQLSPKAQHNASARGDQVSFEMGACMSDLLSSPRPLVEEPCARQLQPITNNFVTSTEKTSKLSSCSSVNLTANIRIKFIGGPLFSLPSLRWHAHSFPQSQHLGRAARNLKFVPYSHFSGRVRAVNNQARPPDEPG